MKCPIHNVEMGFRNGGGEDHYVYIEFVCPTPECVGWWILITERDLVEGWRKRPPRVEKYVPPTPKELDTSQYPKLSDEELRRRREEYLARPRKIVYD